MSNPKQNQLGTLLLVVAAIIAANYFYRDAPPANNNPPENHAAPEHQVIEQAPDRVGVPAGRHLEGYVPNKRETERFLRSLPKPTIREAAPHLLRGADDGKPVLLYRALYEAYAATHAGGKWTTSTQGIGDCVSHGWAHGADAAFAVMWKLGLSSTWKPVATESIYGGARVEANGGSLGGWSDGAYGGGAAKWVKDYGLIFRQPYPDFGIDLTTYSSQTAKQWGNYGNGGQGDSGRFDLEAKKHPVRHVALVTNFTEAAAAIASGYPVPVCSGYGFTYQRDIDGFSSRSGSWSHCMCFIAVRYAPRPGLLCLNSWGTKMFTGPKWPEDQPDGSFWVDSRVCDGMLAGRDSFAVSGSEGFPYRDLKHGDWVETRPKPVRRYVERIQQTETQYAVSP